MFHQNGRDGSFEYLGKFGTNVDLPFFVRRGQTSAGVKGAALSRGLGGIRALLETLSCQLVKDARPGGLCLRLYLI